MNIKLGFSTGCFYKTSLNLIERISLIKNAGCRAIELGFVKIKRSDTDDLKRLAAKELGGFDYVSLHAPKHHYGQNKKTYEIFEIIKRVNATRELDCVVIHPDTITDCSVFRDTGFKIALENMDNRKASHQFPDEFVGILTKYPQPGFVLDVNHVFSNDPSMKLAAEFYEKLGERITQIHLSGYTGYHAALFETRQAEIIQAIQNFKTPIIIESVISPENIRKEIDYILETTGQLRK